MNSSATDNNIARHIAQPLTSKKDNKDFENSQNFFASGLETLRWCQPLTNVDRWSFSNGRQMFCPFLQQSLQDQVTLFSILHSVHLCGACSHLIIFMSLQINLEKNNFIRKTSVIVLRHIVIIISKHICSRCHNYANNTKKIKFLIHTLSFCLFLRGWTSSFSDNAVLFRPPVTGQPNFSFKNFHSVVWC